MEELIIISLILLSCGTIYCFHKLFNKEGLYYSIVLLNIISFIFMFKIAYILRTNINIGIIPLVASFAVIYIFINKYDTKEIKNLEFILLGTNITIAILLTILNYYIPALTETVSINLEATFITNYKILIIYPIIVFCSQYAIIKLYSLLMKIQPSIILTVILNYIITSLIYTIMFSLIAYINILPIKNSLFIGISTYIFGLIENIFITVFVYFMTKKKVKKWLILY